MIYNSFGLRISLCLVLLLIATYFFNIKPKFVIPSKYFNFTRYSIYKIVNIIIICSILILPLDLKFISNKKIITEKILPVQIILDVSLSMAADDIQPSRYDAAKNALIQLIKKLEGYNISLITFSGIPFIYIPFSTDTYAIISKLKNTNLGDFPPTENFIGTAIGDALLLGIKNLDKIRLQDPEYPGLIILITDGDSNKGYDPMQVMSLLQKKKVPVFVLGLGKPDYLIGYDKWGSPVFTSVNIPLLQQISKQTGGEFYRVLGEDNFEEFFNYLKDIIKSQERQKIENQYIKLNKYILPLLGICLLFLFYTKILAFRALQGK